MKIKTWRQIVGARNFSLKVISFQTIILGNTDLTFLTASPCVISWLICLTDKHLVKSSPNKFRDKRSLFYVTRRSIGDVAGVLATPLKLMNYVSLAMNKKVKVFKNGPGKICGRQSLLILLGPFLNTLIQKLL